MLINTEQKTVELNRMCVFKLKECYFVGKENIVMIKETET